MANLSDATVDIYCEKVGKELVRYIKANQDTDYAIVYGDVSEDDVDKDGNIEIHSGSSGRWFYGNNLEGYFDDNHVKQWLGVSSDYSWVKDDKQKAKYQSEAEKSYNAYLELIKAMKERGGRIDISFNDCDPAMDWMGEGSAMLEVFEGNVVFTQSFEEERLNINRYAEINKMDLVDAFDCLHGSEVADAWQEYVKECEKKGEKPKNAQEWYDNDFNWEE